MALRGDLIAPEDRLTFDRLFEVLSLKLLAILQNQDILIGDPALDLFISLAYSAVITKLKSYRYPPLQVFIQSSSDLYGLIRLVDASKLFSLCLNVNK